MEDAPFISSSSMLELQQTIETYFPVLDYLVDWQNEMVRYRISIATEKSTQVSNILRDIRKLGYMAAIRPYRNEYTHVIEVGEYWLLVGEGLPSKKKSLKWNIILFAATLVTTTWAGFSLATSPLFVLYYGITNPWPTALLFTIGVMGIIGTHELGHMVASVRHGLPWAFPYFIPIPPIPGFLNIGTMGAVIRQEEPFMDKNVLFDVGISGPLVGLVTSIFVIAAGYLLSIEVPMTPAEFLAMHPLATSLPSPILFDLIGLFFTSNSGYVLLIHPVAFAGWIGCFLTALQLLPAAQLDGGHIAYAILGRKWHKWATYISIVILALMNLLTMALLLLVLSYGQGHPETLETLSPLSKSRKLLALSVIPIILLTFPPLFLVGF